MKKRMLQTVGSLVMCAAFLAPMAGMLAACGQKTTIDNEKTPLVFSAQEFDEVFNPFYSTNAADSEIAGMTQIGMLSADDSGKVAYGDDEPVVVKDYTSVMYDKNGNKTETGDKDGYTVYQFIIKKGIKFSDGADLTIKDVLFNLYVYLDPVYTGSSTIYSTDIQGLAKYRMQNPNISDGMEDAETGFNQQFLQNAQDRLGHMRDYLDGTYLPEDNDEKAEIEQDVVDFKAEFKSMLLTDWNTCSGLLESYVDEYDMQYKEEWEVFLILEGMLQPKKDSRGFVEKTSDGKYILDYSSLDQEEIAGYRTMSRDEIVNTVYDGNTIRDSSVANIVKEGWSCVGTFLDKLIADEKTKYFDSQREQNGGTLRVPNIEGIKALKGNQFLGTTGNYDDYDMLQITINGVDPKAIWNFGFSVSPAHYYSGTYKGKDYVEALKNADVFDSNNSEFGVCFGDLSFYEQVLKARNRVPMGAGAYKASTLGASQDNVSYDASKDFSILRDGFLQDNIVYFERNTYFNTVIGTNAKIKYIRYKVVNTSSVLNALTASSPSNQIHYADPSATTANINEVDRHSNLHRITALTNGYGYIGMNARFINDINVRRAIMTTMDVSLVLSYYPEGFVNTLTRPMSMVSWVYNEYEQAGIPALNETTAPAKYPYDRTFARGRQILEDAGYVYNEAKKTWTLDGKPCTFKYTFTIAGETMDHPAYATMYQSSQILNENGFDITVKTSANALRDLAAGDLTCWAAAWSSTIDPDMYQVYHKNSNASSVDAWGYDWMIDQGNGSTEELQIINDLSDLIDRGREMLDEASRTQIYRQALDKVMDLAVELPTYQRRDMYVYNAEVIDETTLNLNPTPFTGPISKLWLVSLKETK